MDVLDNLTGKQIYLIATGFYLILIIGLGAVHIYYMEKILKALKGK